MCGRFVASTPTDRLLSFFGAIRSDRLSDEVAEAVVTGPRAYNIAPTTVIRIVVEEPSGRMIDLARWGLEPWADATRRSGYVNARSEGVDRRPAFRDAYRRRRCIVPAEGFYEWAPSSGGRRTPFFLARPDGAPLALAGIWSPSRSTGTGYPSTCAILTCAANDDVAPVHDRMPVLLDEADWDTWLSASPAGTAQAALLRPAPAGSLSSRPVDPVVGSVRSTGAGLLDRYDPDRAEGPSPTG